MSWRDRYVNGSNVIFQLQHPDPARDLRLPNSLDRDLLLPHEHRTLVQATHRSSHPAAEESQEKEEKGTVESIMFIHRPYEYAMHQIIYLW